jgi:hypothetical protein
MPISDTDQHTPFNNITTDGVTSIDTFNTWRKKTNGIIKVINDGLITRYIRDAAITPQKLSSGGPSWDTPGTFHTNGAQTRIGYARSGAVATYIGYERPQDGASQLFFRTSGTTAGRSVDTASIIRTGGINGNLTVYNKNGSLDLNVDTLNIIKFNINNTTSASISSAGLNVVNNITAKNIVLKDTPLPFYSLKSDDGNSALEWALETNSSRLYIRSGASIIPTSITFVDSTNRVNLTGHQFQNGDLITFAEVVSDQGPNSSVGASISVPYYIINRTTNDFQISSSIGGTPINFISNGTGKLSTSVVDSPLQILNTNNVVIGGQLNATANNESLIVTGTSLFTQALRANLGIVSGYKTDASDAVIDIGESRTQNGKSILNLYSNGSAGNIPSASITREGGTSGKLVIKNTGTGTVAFETDAGTSDTTNHYEFKINNFPVLQINRSGKVTIPGKIQIDGGFENTVITSSDSSNRLINAYGDGYNISIVSASQIGGTVTVTINSYDSHDLRVGSQISVEGLKIANITTGALTLSTEANGSFTIKSLSGTNTFVYDVQNTSNPNTNTITFYTRDASFTTGDQSYFKLGTSVMEDYYLIVGGKRQADDITNIVLRSHNGDWLPPQTDSGAYNTDGLRIYKESGLNGHAGIQNSGNAATKFTLENLSTGNIILKTNSTDRLTINGSTGAVGIGKVPASGRALDVAGDVYATTFFGSFSGTVAGKANTAGTADTSIVLETPNIKIAEHTLYTNDNLRIAFAKKNGDTSTPPLNTIFYDGAKNEIARIDGSTASLVVSGNVNIAASKSLIIPQSSAADRSAVIQTGSWYFGQSSNKNQTDNFYIHNGSAATATPVLSINSSSGLITGKISNAFTADALSSTLAVDKGGTGAITPAAARTNLGAAPLESPNFTGTPKILNEVISTQAYVNSIVASGISAANAPTVTGQGATGTWNINISGTANNADNVKIDNLDESNIAHGLVFFQPSTSNYKRLLGDYAGLSYVPTTNTLTASKFIGQLIGPVTGIASGNIKQGGGTDQTANNIFVGWSNAGKLRVQVDSENFGANWPIDIRGQAETVKNGVYTSGDQTINGIKTFTSSINGNISGNANSVTGGMYLTADQNITGFNSFISLDAGIGDKRGGLHRLNCVSTGNGAAGMTFHRPGRYAVHFGLDTDNKLKVGGWSMGEVAHEIVHAGNSQAFDSRYAAAVKSGGLSTNGNQINPGSHSTLALTYQAADGTSGTFYDTTIFNGRQGEIARFRGSDGHQRNSGNIEIRNEGPVLYLNDINHRSAMIHVNSNHFYIARTTAPGSTSWGGSPFYINLDNYNAVFEGSVYAAGDVVAYHSSDKRLKDNIQPITDSLHKVCQLSGVTFTWNDKQDTHTGDDVGVIAQEVEAVLPEATTTRADGYKAVKYEKIIPLLIESIKELTHKVETLESKLSKLEAK